MRLLPRRLSAVLVLALAIGSSLPTQMASAESGSTCLSRLNSARKSAGLPLVSNSGVLSLAAQRHANYRARTDALGLTDASAHFETAGRAYYTGVRPWTGPRLPGCALAHGRARARTWSPARGHR